MNVNFICTNLTTLPHAITFFIHRFSVKVFFCYTHTRFIRIITLKNN